MEDRSITLDFVKGEIKGVWLKATLDQTYKRLFENACKSSKKYQKNVSHGIKIIIFGCFWLEAFANDVLRMILQYEISSQKFKEEIWERMKRTTIEEKAYFFSKLCSQEIQSGYVEIKSEIKQLFDLRNRLSHYKEKPKKIADEIELEEFFTKFRNDLPVPEMNEILMWGKAKIYASNVKRIAKWFNEVIKFYYKKEGIKHSTVKAKPITTHSSGR